MRKIVQRGLLAGMGFVLASFSPRLGYSAEGLAMLDPSAQAASLCGGDKGGASLTRMLMLANTLIAPAGSAATPMPLYPDLSAPTFPVSTASDRAKRYFNQGLMLTYGFNHAGAVRSFREAQRLDPNCALCWWGEAAALGPNINAPMDDRDRATTSAALDRAVALRGNATPVEQALIDALAKRYSSDPKADRAQLDAAYAEAMLEAARRFPTQDDVAVLAAEAVMDTSPWNYWQRDRKTPLNANIAEAVRMVEAVLARNPDHAQAAHLYIHLLEASDPKRAEAAADRLGRPLAPSAGHLVHMPGHIYQRLGRHKDSIRVNIAAARADEAWIKSSNDHGLVRYGYYPHNIHFIVTSAQMAGDMATALREAWRLRTVLDVETSAKIAWIQAIDAAPFQAMAQFASPERILAMKAPDPRLPYATAMRHYARAVAYAQRRDKAGFDREIAAIAALRGSDKFASMIEQGVPAKELLSLAEEVARGRYAFAQGRYGEAAAHYKAATLLEGRIPYQEPPWWYYPVSQSLGAALYRAGRYDDASLQFRVALLRAPGNGWALYGLAESEKAQGHAMQAAAARKALDRAWLGSRGLLRMERL